MVIGVISDTHDKAEGVLKAFEYFLTHKVSVVVHVGDWRSPEFVEYVEREAASRGIKIIGVLGNRDTNKASILEAISREGVVEVSSDPLLELEIEGKRIAVTHGDRKKLLRESIVSKKFDVVITGHTHKPKIERVGSTLVVNPGSTAFSIQRSKEFNPSLAILGTEKIIAKIVFL